MSDDLPVPAHRPLFSPTADQRAVVARMVGAGMPLARTALAITNPDTGKPISVPTLTRHFEAEIRAGRAEVDEKMCGYLLEHCRQNFSALRYFEETRWRETEIATAIAESGARDPNWHRSAPVLEVSTTAAPTENELNLDFARRVAFLLEKAARRETSTASS